MKKKTSLSAENREILSLLAFVYLENNLPDKAALLLAAMEVAGAADSRSQCTLALCQLRSGKPKAALATLNALAMQTPPSAVFHLIRSDCLHELGRHDEAAAAMRAYVAMRLSPPPPHPDTFAAEESMSA